MELLKLESQELIKDEDVAGLKLIGTIYIEMRSLSCQSMQTKEIKLGILKFYLFKYNLLT